MNSPDNLASQIIRRSTGPFGDFQMPTCARLIESDGIPRGWALQIGWDVVLAILKRYKEHATFWNASRNVVKREIEMFSNSLAKAGLYYPPEQLVSTFDTL